MKNFDRLLIVLFLLVVLACKCQSDLFNSAKTRQAETAPIPVKTVSDTAPNPNDFGEYKQCSERGKLDFNSRGESVGLTVNNNSPVEISVYRIGPDNYQSKYSDIAPGKSQTYKSAFRGDWWMITDSKGRCQMLVSPPNTVNVK